MEHARLNLMTADPRFLEDAVRFVELDARAQIEREPGHRGLSVATDAEVGVAVVASFWVSHDAMKEGERLVRPLFDQAARKATATVSHEQFEVANSVRFARPEAGAGVRITRSEVAPPRMDAAITDYEDAALPWLSEVDGLCSTSLFVHRRTGRAVHETVWRDAGALAASRSRAAEIRVEAATATDAQIRALEEYLLVFTSTPA
jgi:heme-degrading monooxygenase HmoA